MKAIFLGFLCVFSISTIYAGDHGGAKFNSGRYQVNADRLERALNTATTLAPLVPSLGRFVPSAGTIEEVMDGRIPSRWPLARVVKEAAGGIWLANQCGRLAVSKDVDDRGQAYVFIDDFSSQPADNLKICFNGENKAKSNQFPWHPAAVTKSPNGKNLGMVAFALGIGNFSYITVKGMKADGSPCYSTVRVDRSKDGIKVTRVLDQSAAMPEGDPYGFGALINAHRAKHGLPPVTYLPELDNSSHQNNVQQFNNHNVGHFYNPTLRNSVTLQNASRRTSVNAAMYGDGVYDKVGWVHSAGHNAAMLDPNAKFYGISALQADPWAYRPANDYYWTLTLTYQ